MKKIFIGVFLGLFVGTAIGLWLFRGNEKMRPFATYVGLSFGSMGGVYGASRGLRKHRGDQDDVPPGDS